MLRNRLTTQALRRLTRLKVLSAKYWGGGNLLEGFIGTLCQALKAIIISIIIAHSPISFGMAKPI